MNLLIFSSISPILRVLHSNIFNVFCELKPYRNRFNVCLSHPIYSEEVEPIVTKFGETRSSYMRKRDTIFFYIEYGRVGHEMKGLN